MVSLQIQVILEGLISNDERNSSISFSVRVYA